MVPPAGLRSLLVLAAVSVLLGGGFLGSCSLRAAGSGTGGCARARVGGRLVCLRAGQPCEPGHERVYRSYGLTCRYGGGGYRLREWSFIAPANP